MRKSRKIREKKEPDGERDLDFSAVFKSAFYANPVPMAISTPDDGRLIEVNEAFLKLLGRSRAEVVGGFSLQFGALTDPAMREAALFILREEGRLRSFEAQVRDGAGQTRYVLLSADLLHLPDQRLLLSVLEDITQCKCTEQALRESEQSYRDLIESARSVVVKWDVQGNVTFWNEYAERLFGFSREEILGRNLVGTIVPAVEESGRDLVRILDQIRVDPDRFQNNENENITKDGRRVWLRWNNRALRDEHGALYGILSVGIDISKRRAAEQALRRSEREKALILDSAFEMFTYFDSDLRIRWANKSYCDNVGVAVDELAGRRCHELWYNSEQTCPDCPVVRARDTGRPQEAETVSPDGRRWFLRGYPVFDEAGRLEALIEFGQDITAHKQAEEERARLEEQLRQAQKMEAIGHLAGGVAHDFNNLLQVILGFLDLAESELPAGAASGRSHLEQIRKAALQAADLTRQLLAFGRRQVIRPARLDLNSVIHGILMMIRRVIGEDIELRFIPSGRLGTVCADKGQIEQVLMNLCVNARDAMPGGGTLTIETANVAVGEEFRRRQPWAAEGLYVSMAVSDSGQGMDEKTRERIFEPFFTTKEVGKGTGLGLATVYGIVKQHGGMITVASEPGRGSTFQVYLPAVDQQADTAEEQPETPSTGGSETILVAEDEPALLNLVRCVLAGAGYRVLTARDGVEALEVFARHSAQIDLVLLDVVMPRLGGRAVLERIRRERPDMRYLFTSGHSKNTVHSDFVIREGVRLIQKPYRLNDLLRALREALDAPPAP